MKLFRILFYQYHWLEVKWRGRTPGWDALYLAIEVFTVGTFFWWNSIFLLLTNVLYLDLSPSFVLISTAITAGVMIIDTCYKKRFENIISDDSYSTKRNWWISILYFVGSFLFFIITVIMLCAANNELIYFPPPYVIFDIQDENILKWFRVR